MNDKEVEKLIAAEIKREEETVNLIPSENFVSPGVLGALGSVFTNKYAEGYPGARYYGGNQYADEVERLAQERARELFNLSANWHVNVQPYSGSPANLAVYAALVPLGEKIMGLQLDMGGHLTHGHKVSFTGKAWQAVTYAVDKETELLDYGEVKRIAEKEKPKIIIAGYTAYPYRIDFEKFREISDSIGAYLMVDMSHFAGLVAGRAYPSPFEYADIVTSTVHKTLRGPRSAVIFANSKSKTAKIKNIDIAKKIDRAVFPGLQGGPHLNQIAAIATTFYEAAQPEFRDYADQVVRNAKTLADSLKKLGFRIVANGTETHLLLVNLGDKNIGGSEASDLLEGEGIIVNKNTIPYDPRSPMDPSGIRLGTPAITTRGMKEGEMEVVADLISRVLVNKEKVKGEVEELCRRYPLKYDK